MQPPLKLTVVVLIASLGCGCARTEVATKVYDLSGKVVKLNPKEKSVTLNHDVIPEVLDARKRKFDVVDEKTLEGVKVGDVIHAKLRVSPGDYTIVDVHNH